MVDLTPDYEWERDLENDMTDTNLAEENIQDEFDRLRILYLEWVEDYCNVLFDKDRLPGSVELALDELVKTDPMKYNIQSQKLSDMSITYGTGTNGGSMPRHILAWLEPYRRMHTLDKKKRAYNDGR